MLRACEFEIDSGLATFVRVGSALAAIRDGRLYRQTHSTFEAYSVERWNLKRQRAYELIDAAAIAGNVSEVSDTPPQRESHVAPLASLSSAEQREVWRESVETAPRRSDGQPRITSHHVRITGERRWQQAVHTNLEGRPSNPPPALDAPSQVPTEKAPKVAPSTVLGTVQIVVNALGAGDAMAVRNASAAALRVLARRRMGTSPETLAKALEALLRAIAGAAQ